MTSNTWHFEVYKVFSHAALYFIPKNPIARIGHFIHKMGKKWLNSRYEIFSFFEERECPLERKKSNLFVNMLMTDLLETNEWFAN